MSLCLVVIGSTRDSLCVPLLVVPRFVHGVVSEALGPCACVLDAFQLVFPLSWFLGFPFRFASSLVLGSLVAAFAGSLVSFFL